MFFPNQDYTIPTSSKYMRLVEGKNKFRVLSSAIVGWEYWNTQDKPVRQQEPFEDVPDDIKHDKDGRVSIKHFWAFAVWNYQEKKIQILELTQKSIMNAIKSYVDEESWGDPKQYDIVITRSGSGFDTEYQTIANPHTPPPAEAVEEYGNKTINLNALFDGTDPFSS